MKNLLLLTLFIGILGGWPSIGFSADPETAQITKGTMGDLNYIFRSNTYFMGQPTAKTLDAAKAEGVTTVINLRTKDEIKALKFDPAKDAINHGLNYYNYPIDGSQALDAATMKKIDDTFMLHHKKGEKVIVHCAAGQRAAAWFAYHVKTTHKSDSASALKEAEEVGLTSPKLIENVKALIK